VSEGAAYGAALQALWCWRNQSGEKISIQDITNRFVELNKAETAQPKPRNVAVYAELQGLQDELSHKLRDIFVRHREFLTKELK